MQRWRRNILREECHELVLGDCLGEVLQEQNFVRGQVLVWHLDVWTFRGKDSRCTIDYRKSQHASRSNREGYSPSAAKRFWRYFRLIGLVYRVASARNIYRLRTWYEGMRHTFVVQSSLLVRVEVRLIKLFHHRVRPRPRK